MDFPLPNYIWSYLNQNNYVLPQATVEEEFPEETAEKAMEGVEPRDYPEDIGVFMEGGEVLSRLHSEPSTAAMLVDLSYSHACELPIRAQVYFWSSSKDCYANRWQKTIDRRANSSGRPAETPWQWLCNISVLSEDSLFFTLERVNILENWCIRETLHKGNRGKEKVYNSQTNGTKNATYFTTGVHLKVKRPHSNHEI